ncbi:Ubiquinol-cytochrome c chaperone domain-containing protein [Madurella fahalii]|uniref:Ubiquinol-cytochrome c chaperone domain-containing protein n=1 Tax=Madurella fahalii TaxID=1157608 RepID=A0ABQ0GSC0_9PEZI
MACSSCSASLGLLPRRLGAPLRQNLFHNVHSPSSICAGMAIPSTSLSLLAATPNSNPRRTARRALHTPSPRQKLDLKKLIVGRVVQSLGAQRSNYYIYAATERLYKACAAQADYVIEAADRKAGTLKTTVDGEEIGVSKGGEWHNDLSLLPTFSTWAHVTMLHMYLLVVRFRCLDKVSQQAWQAQLVNHFFYQAEAKMELVHDLSSRMIRQQYLKDLFVQWRGLILAYDEGLVKGDAVLASAVWRNLFKASEDVDVRVLAAVVSWMRAGLAQLGDMPNEAVEAEGEKAIVRSVIDEFKSVDVPSGAMRTAFEQAGIIGKPGEAKSRP